ncbi:YheC/YheD family protein [Neobacillus rhizosphaerae]|uniref:YheC/YheD family endospore coat-associated protein n=1 Tax=Neobacillus rhizosphaerae TaxID=2880965 RepID=UPI003D28858C
MITLGIMTLTMDSEQSYINDIARHAKECQMEVFRFSPSLINPHTLMVNGRKYQPMDQSWVECECPVPTIIYDRCFYGDDDHSKQCMPIVSWLKSRQDITFLGYGLPNKLELYHSLKDTLLSSYLPVSQAVSEPAIIIQKLSSHQRVILKPVNGSQGYGIYYLKRNDRSYQVKTEKNKEIITRIFPNETKLLLWLNTLLKKHKYLLQPYLELSNNELQPFDIRVLLQKDEKGDWVERGRGVRVGSTGGILSNLSAGGSVFPFNTWLKTIPTITAEYIRQELIYILTNLPSILEQEFMPLFEIGIDIGVAKNGGLWILDMNSKPGRKVLLQTQPDVQEVLSRAPLLYGKYLSQSEETERKIYYEKTLSH